MFSMNKEELKELYDKDFPLWAEINLELLKQKQYDLVDWENVIEEFEYIAKSDLRDCIKYLANILDRLYRLDYFKNLVNNQNLHKKWKNTILYNREMIELLFSEYPSLRHQLPKELQKAWKEAILNLQEWLEKNDYNPEDFEFPKECPYTYEEAMTKDLERTE